MAEFYVLEFTHLPPEVVEVTYKHVKCGICGVRPTARVGKTGVRFSDATVLVDFSRTAQGILVREPVVNHLTAARISGWRPGCVEVQKTPELKEHDTRYYELVIIGHTNGYSRQVRLEIEAECRECGRRVFSYPKEKLSIPESSWDGSDIFVISELPGIYVATEDFRKVVEECQHTGLEFVHIDEWYDWL